MLNILNRLSFFFYLAIPQNPEIIRLTAIKNYEEVILLIRRFSKVISEDPGDSHLSVLDKLNLFNIPLEYLIQSQMVGLPPDSKARDDLLRKSFNELDNMKFSEIVLIHLINSFSPNLVATEMTRIAHVISKYDGASYPFHKVLVSILEAVKRSEKEIEVRFSKNRKTLQKLLKHFWTINVAHLNNDNQYNFLR